MDRGLSPYKFDVITWESDTLSKLIGIPHPLDLAVENSELMAYILTISASDQTPGDATAFYARFWKRALTDVRQT